MTQLNFTVEANVPDVMALTMKRSGFSVVRSESGLRVRVGSHLLPRDNVKVVMENGDGEQHHTTPEKRKALT